LTSILHLETRPKLKLAQTGWISPPERQPRASVLRWWLQTAVSCVAAFAFGWAIQVFVVPALVQSADVAAPIAAQTLPPEPVQVPAAVVPPPIATPPIPVARPVSDFANRPRTRFVARIGKSIAVTAGVQLLVTGIATARIDATLTTPSGARMLKDQALLQSIGVDSAAGLDLIFTASDGQAVTGYVLLPRP
jgi:hypothetical protein